MKKCYTLENKRSKLVLLVVITLINLISASIQAQTTRYVKPNGTGDGTTWATASGDLQAMMSAEGVTQVWVAAGRYVPIRPLNNLSLVEPGNRNNAFVLRSGVRVYGGFVGNETNLTQRQWIQNETILSGDFQHNDIITGAGESLSITGNEENAYHVVVARGAYQTSYYLDGFTISGGNANGVGSTEYQYTEVERSNGGGIYNKNLVASAENTFNNLKIVGNRAIEKGAGIYAVWSSTLNMQHITVAQNDVYSTMENVTGMGVGGGMYISGCNATIKDAIIRDNKAGTRSSYPSSGSGGGAYIHSTVANPVILERLQVTGNYTVGGANQTRNGEGGGLYCAASENQPSLTLKAAVISGNSARVGGGISLDFSAAVITNTLVSGNKAISSGGGIYGNSSSPVLTNVTIAGNSRHGFFSNSEGKGVLRNTIIWGNELGLVDFNAAVTTSHNSLIQGLSSTANNNVDGTLSSNDPLFVQDVNFATAPVTAGNFALQSCSPLLNIGENNFVSGENYDLAGNARIRNGDVDLGAYESSAVTCVYTKRYVKVGGTGNGSSWANASGDIQAMIDAEGVEEVWVAGGTYYPTRRFNSLNIVVPGNRSNAFVLKKDVKIYGGFAGHETSIGQRELSNDLYKTTLSGDFNDNDIVTVTANSVVGITGNNENALHVVVGMGDVGTATLNGLTIKGGNANEGTVVYVNGFAISGQSGSGVFLVSSSPTFEQVIITGNIASTNGGGVYNKGSSPIFKNCVFYANHSNNGGALYNDNSAPTLINSIITGNSTATTNTSLRTVFSLTNASLRAINTIIWKNNRGISGSYNLTSSLVQGIAENATNGVLNGNNGNLRVFADWQNASGDDGVWGTSDDGLRLDPCSELVNAGTADTTGLFLSSVDVKGEIRINKERIDIGAYENHSPCYTDIRYVKQGATGAGSSWEDASGDLQAMINSTGAKQLWVARGTYYPARKANNLTEVDPGNRDNAFVLKKDVKIYGGFAGTETNLSERDLLIGNNKTILSGDFNNDDVVTVSENSAVSVSGNSENAYHVVISVGDVGTATLNGLTIQGGNANVSSNLSVNGRSIWRASGAGVFLLSSSPVFEQVVFIENFANANGGAVYTNTSLPFFVNCVFYANRANNGGVLFNDQSTPTFINSTVTGNSAISNTGAIIRSGGVGAIFKAINTVIWKNDKGISGNSDIANSLVQGVAAVPTNGVLNGTDANLPVFTNWHNSTGYDGVLGTPDDGLRPADCSPIINVGKTDNTTGVSFPTIDITGAERIKMARVDLGAYETQAEITTANIAQSNQTATNLQDHSSVLSHYISSCNEIVASVMPSGTNRITGLVTAKVWIETEQPELYVKRHYEITPQVNPGTATGQVVLYFTNQEFKDFNNQIPAAGLLLPDADDPATIEARKANVLIEKRSGVSSDNSGTPSSYSGSIENIAPPASHIVWQPATQRWEIHFTITSGFSGFFLKTQSEVLPLTLLSFTAKEENCITVLDWRTTDEVNVSHFEVTQSVDGVSYTPVETIVANGLPGENKYSVQLPVSNAQTFYRLKMVDIDGQYTYSTIVKVLAPCVAQKVTLYPNPAGNTLFIKNAAIGSSYSVYDNLGRRVLTGMVGSNLQQVNLTGLSKGVYYITTGADTHKVVKE